MNEISPEDLPMPDWALVDNPTQLDPEKAAEEANEDVDPDH